MCECGKKVIRLLPSFLAPLLLVDVILLQLLDEFGKLILCGQWTGIVGASRSGATWSHLVGIAWATGTATSGTDANR